MGKCTYSTKTGKCGVETPGKSRKCEDHKGLKCQVCGGIAWHDCPDVDCEAVVCSKPECVKWHIDNAHDGQITRAEKKPNMGGGVTGDKLDRKSGPKGEDVTDQTNMCPFCEPMTTKRMLVKAWNRHDSKTNGKKCQVVCLECGMRGPSVTSRKLALGWWNDLPNKHLAPYEDIRVMALRIIEREMKVLDKLSRGEPLSNETQVALSKMAEAATMMIDTWNL